MTYRQKREDKYINQEYLEPDIKEGLGLRDLHFMAWMAKIYFKSRHLRQIKKFSVFSFFGLDKLHDSQSFLLKVRNHLHLLAGRRREDRLLLPYQERISQSLGYKNGPYNTGPEKFMRDLYLHLNRIRFGSEEFHMKTMDIVDPRPVEPTPSHLPPEFQVMKGSIVLKEEPFRQDPMLILKALMRRTGGAFPRPGFIWEASKGLWRRGRDSLLSQRRKERFLT
jgi:[protein-PII] uridylyltransferase